MDYDFAATRNKNLSFEEFLDLICSMRPDKSASVLDVAELRRSMRNQMNTVVNRMKQQERSVNRKLEAIAEKLGVPRSTRSGKDRTQYFIERR